MMQRTKDLLSLSNHSYCPEGYIPGTRTGVRIITNSPTLAPTSLAYLDRAPKKEPTSQPITAYLFEGDGESSDETFSVSAIEEILQDRMAKSIAAVVVFRSPPSLPNILSGLQPSSKGLQCSVSVI
jgi:hypothetical protein